MEKGPGAQAGSGKKDVNMPDMVKKNFFFDVFRRKSYYFFVLFSLVKRVSLKMKRSV